MTSPPPLPRHVDAPTLWPKVVSASLILHAAVLGLVWHVTRATQATVIPIEIVALDAVQSSAEGLDPGGASPAASANAVDSAPGPAASDAVPPETGTRSDSRSSDAPSSPPALGQEQRPADPQGERGNSGSSGNSGNLSDDAEAGATSGADSGVNSGAESGSTRSPAAPGEAGATSGGPGRPTGVTISFAVEAVAPDLLSQPSLDQIARPTPTALNLELRPGQTVVQTPNGNRCPVSETVWGLLGTPVSMRIAVTQTGDFFDSGVDRAPLNSYEQFVLCLVAGWTYAPAQKQGQPVFSDEQRISVTVSGPPS